MGLFLTEDPFQGEVNNPPSLHRYLYAYQNPTVWVDPTGEQNELLEPSRPRVIDSPSEAPEGWTVKWIGEGIYLAHPPDSAPQPAPGSQAEEPDVLDRLYDLVFGDAEEEGAKLVEEGAELERTFDRGIFRDVELDVENMTEEELRAALEEARGRPAAGETVRQGGRVAGQAGTTALEAEETASAVTLVGLFRGLGRKALRLFGKEAGEETAEEAAEQVARRGTTGAARQLPFADGDVILRELDTSQGILDVAAEVEIKGGTLHLKGIAIFPRGSENLDLGPREVLALRSKLAQEAADLGFDKLRISGTRVTGANPGKQPDLLIDLSKHR